MMGEDDLNNGAGVIVLAAGALSGAVATLVLLYGLPFVWSLVVAVVS